MSKKTKIKIGAKTITTANVTADFEHRFNSLEGKHFENLQAFLQALEQTKNNEDKAMG